MCLGIKKFKLLIPKIDLEQDWRKKFVVLPTPITYSSDFH